MDFLDGNYVRTTQIKFKMRKDLTLQEFSKDRMREDVNIDDPIFYLRKYTTFDYVKYRHFMNEFYKESLKDDCYINVGRFNDDMCECGFCISDTVSNEIYAFASRYNEIKLYLTAQEIGKGGFVDEILRSNDVDIKRPDRFIWAMTSVLLERNFISDIAYFTRKEIERQVRICDTMRIDAENKKQAEKAVTLLKEQGLEKKKETRLAPAQPVDSASQENGSQ